MTEESSVQEHGVRMLSPVEKLEDLKAGFDNDTLIDVILQLLPPSYDPFIVNFNKNWLEKSINELINMLVQYEAMTKKSMPSVLVGNALTSKAKGRRAERWKRKKGKAKAKAVIATKDAKTAPVALLGVTQRSKKLSKDEVVLRLGDGKTVAAEAVGTINLVSYFVPSMIKNTISIPLLDNAGFEILINKNYFYLMKGGSSHLLDLACKLGHISQDRIKRLVDSKSLEIDNLDILPARESCLKGKITRKPFVGQSMFANGLLDLIHTEVCGPLNTQARGTSSAPTISTNNVPVLRKSAGVPQPLERYGFLGVTGQLDKDPKTYGEAMSDINSGKWLEAIKSEIDSISSNHVWTLVDRPKGVKPIRCKWVYKLKIDANMEVTTFKARLVAKGYTQ
ncbi:UNVERIFIED_CONTAM: Retrovirus-related Pol polyprotein from transposon TNT 1-94 [Sesamum calycinum]|uniref:Retrovirus-related Pol polyprotein from transposon TNT 1-94 n=1 Tax=Sesamum calycinum TaxID=2727403 RepID=A0AAW2JC33_9LAMI